MVVGEYKEVWIVLLLIVVDKVDTDGSGKSFAVSVNCPEEQRIVAVENSASEDSGISADGCETEDSPSIEQLLLLQLVALLSKDLRRRLRECIPCRRCSR